MSSRVDKAPGFRQTRPLSSRGASKDPDAKKAKISSGASPGADGEKKGRGKASAAAAAALAAADVADDIEEVLKTFDLNSKWGPCIGITRLERWERAEKLGLKPPENIRKLLVSSGDDYQKCLWEDRV